jgi:hypothetical protein
MLVLYLRPTARELPLLIVVEATWMLTGDAAREGKPLTGSKDVSERQEGETAVQAVLRPLGGPRALEPMLGALEHLRSFDIATGRVQRRAALRARAAGRRGQQQREAAPPGPRCATAFYDHTARIGQACRPPPAPGSGPRANDTTWVAQRGVREQKADLTAPSIISRRKKGVCNLAQHRGTMRRIHSPGQPGQQALKGAAPERPRRVR